MIKLRLWGHLEELAAATQGLKPGERCTLTLTVDSVSSPDKDRGKSVLYRVYVEGREVTSSTTTTTKPATKPAAKPSAVAEPAAPAAKSASSGEAIPLEIPEGTNA